MFLRKSFLKKYGLLDYSDVGKAQILDPPPLTQLQLGTHVLEMISRFGGNERLVILYLISYILYTYIILISYIER